MSEREKVLLKSARPLPYRTLEDGSELFIHFYLPRDFREGEPRAVFLFFNSGAWERGSVIEFAPQALYYVDRGAICGLVEYRNRSSHPASRPTDALGDGRAAIHYLRQHAGSLHLDPSRVIAIGGGAGANIAASAAMGISLPGGDPAVNAAATRPDAAILFSAIIDLNKGSYGYGQCADATEARLLSLSRAIGPGMPPMLLIHGTADRLIPWEDAAGFAGKMARRRNVCEFVEFEGRDRNFYHLNFDPASYRGQSRVPWMTSWTASGS